MGTLLQSSSLTPATVHDPEDERCNQRYSGDGHQRQNPLPARGAGLNFKREEIGAFDLQTIRRRASPDDINGVYARLSRNPDRAFFISAIRETDLSGSAVRPANQSLHSRASHRPPGQFHRGRDRDRLIGFDDHSISPRPQRRAPYDFRRERVIGASAGRLRSRLQGDLPGSGLRIAEPVTEREERRRVVDSDQTVRFGSQIDDIVAPRTVTASVRVVS